MKNNLCLRDSEDGWKAQMIPCFGKYFANYNEFDRVVNVPISPQRHCLKKLNFSDLLEPEVSDHSLGFLPFHYIFTHHRSV